MNIAVITSNYPRESRPANGVFVQELVRAMARHGRNCAVISPVSISDIRCDPFEPKVSYDHAIKDNYIKVLRPRYISFSAKKILNYNTALLTQKSYERATNKSLSCLDFAPGMLYGHFLYPSGAAAVRIASQLGVPSIVAVGESSFWGVNRFSLQKVITDFTHVNGVISVSSAIRKELMNTLMIPEEKIGVFPNGVDLSFFHPRDRVEMRKKLKFPLDKIIIAFIGHFDERKGPHRVLQAVSQVDDVGLLFIGSGGISLMGSNILFKGVLEHSRVPEMLSAADIFVLPTLAEGSCNAIIEAMACGLPVITSKGEFNDDIVNDEVAIRIDPRNIEDIREAIITLRNNRDLRRQLSSNALEKAKQLDINLRARKILDWIAGLRTN